MSGAGSRPFLGPSRGHPQRSATGRDQPGRERRADDDGLPGGTEIGLAPPRPGGCSRPMSPWVQRCVCVDTQAVPESRPSSSRGARGRFSSDGRARAGRAPSRGSRGRASGGFSRGASGGRPRGQMFSMGAARPPSPGSEAHRRSPATATASTPAPDGRRRTNLVVPAARSTRVPRRR